VIRLQLPFPPSVNSLFRDVSRRDGKRAGRIKTQRYLTWIRAATNEAAAQDQKPIRGHVKVRILLGKPDRRKRDLDNLLKAPLDLLTGLSLIEDDSAVQCIQVSWAEVDGALVEVRAA